MRIEPNTCSGLVIDIQEKLLPHMEKSDELISRCLVLIKGLQALDVPMHVTEQYPRGLGPTVESIKTGLQPFSPVEKLAFSCCDEPALLGRLDRKGPHAVIICGIEAHVCVLQTVIDLAGSGYLPVVVADCVSSRNPEDKAFALERMRDEGAVITTSESILFELTREAGTGTFKTISKLVK